MTDLEKTVAGLAAQDIHVGRLVLTSTALAPEVHPETMLMLARRLGLATSRLPSLEAGEEALRLAPVAVEDLLLRPSVKIDYRRLENFIKGKTVAVTGGGGSIGSEICDRVVNFGAGRLLVLENSKSALHAVLERLATKSGGTAVEGRIADIRDRERILRLIMDAEPHVVFHAAALKHVPIVEREWGEGIKTNVFGSVNVADAAIAAGAEAMVMISTDKAIGPVSVLGATKRLAEMYCQAVDVGAARSANGGKPPTRMIAVRFGNVLASNGSVVPKFKAQIEAGGPVTVTHPDMVRYFMTIREACDLVITAASHALGPTRAAASVYVLNMGQPIKIVELAERMIRLSGLEPGVTLTSSLRAFGLASGSTRYCSRAKSRAWASALTASSPLRRYARRSKSFASGLPNSGVNSTKGSATPSTAYFAKRCRISAAKCGDGIAAIHRTAQAEGPDDKGGSRHCRRLGRL